MITGIESAVDTMRINMARQEVAARNLSNLLTPGYKQEVALLNGLTAPVDLIEDWSGLPITPVQLQATPCLGELGFGLSLDGISVDYRQGTLDQTGRPLDVALVGDGFLRVRTPDGEFLTRGGPLQVDAGRRLVTPEGYAVLGREGDLVLPEGAVSFDKDGTIRIDGEAVAALSVVEYQPGTRMAKAAPGLYAPEDPAAVPVEAPLTEVRGGCVEASNVDEAMAMTELVQSLRAYQAAQRMLQSQDELLGQAVNEVGRV